MNHEKVQNGSGLGQKRSAENRANFKVGTGCSGHCQSLNTDLNYIAD